MNQKLLTFLALGFGALIILQALLGGWLFIHNIGITPDEIKTYYADKSLHGVLEVLVPHTLFITISLMAFLHFLSFIDTIEQKTKTYFLHLLFSLFLLDQLTPIGIILGIESFTYLKILFFVGFEVVLGWVWIITFFASIKKN
ncbi:MAG: hypothetical protein Q8O20_00345 [Sulfuricurvum sp.]|uniref:hypothetical protein n=1 Tax=Sulfuricurvum sp. TaxID=2025608 RepID=UPI0027367DD5|nr:hypothetical protein [Sulfuricurvum sp.]MDP2849500.1 hypothetical protein [Sulfuricurvum sp.]